MKSLDADVIRKIDGDLRNRYSDRLARFGCDPKTLGWDTKENQNARFSVAANAIELSGKKVLDVGCGFGDFYTYLSERNIEIAEYVGLDINPDLIDEARRLHPGIKFLEGNILIDKLSQITPDVVVMFGIMNFRFSEMDNREFAQQMLARAYDIARECVSVDMLSEVTDSEYPKEQFVYYYNPAEVLSWAFELSPNVQIRHDFRPIPQKEITLVIRKEPCM